MRNTKRQFIRLGDYITKKYGVEIGQAFVCDKHLGMTRLGNGYKFVFYKIGVAVSSSIFRLTLPEHIDIRDFDTNKLLGDMWDTVKEVPVRKDSASQRTVFEFLSKI